MVDFPKPKPEIEKAEHVPASEGADHVLSVATRSAHWNAHIRHNPTQRHIDGRPPIDAPPTVASRGGTEAMPGKEPGEAGMPEAATQPNTAGPAK